MKATQIILICIIFISIGLAIGDFKLTYSLGKIEGKIDNLKPKETKTIEDYHNLIEESKEKIDEIAADKWLKVSDLKEKFTLFCSGDSYYIEVVDWRELLKKAEDAPQILWEPTPTPTNYSMVDVSIGVTAEQIVEAFKSIDPNSLIRHKKEKTTSDFNSDFTISVN